MSDEQSVDLRLKWQQGEGELRDTNRDSVAVESALEESALETAGGELEAGDDRLAEDAPDGPLVEDEDDYFEWTEEREQAIEDALEFAPEGAVPRVHQQLEAIIKALQAGELDAEQISKLLDEVDSYLDKRIKAELERRAVLDEVLTEARGDKLNALYSYREAAGAVRIFADKGDEMQLKVASYALEQGSGFLIVARDTMLDEEPEWEEELDDEEDLDEEDDFEDDEEFFDEEEEDEEFDED